MLGFLVKIIKPTYALAALLIFGVWNGYSIIKQSPPEPPRTVEGQAQLGPYAAVMADIHPGARIVTWLTTYALICLASVPLINSILAKQSNAANAVMLMAYVALGFFMALVLMAFQFNWKTTFMTFLALGLSALMIITLAGNLEKMRVEDTLVA